jgi:catechol 2,3-dioxygenase-like lactoylglutathione lyase family enzyme
VNGDQADIPLEYQLFELCQSLEFYKRLGFKVEIALTLDGDLGESRALGVPRAIGKAAIMKLGEVPHGTRLDLIDWKEPREPGQPYASLSHLGIGRVALYTTNLRQTYEELKAQGDEFLSGPELPPNSVADVLFRRFKDPDGTILELIEPTARA